MSEWSILPGARSTGGINWNLMDEAMRRRTASPFPRYLGSSSTAPKLADLFGIDPGFTWGDERPEARCWRLATVDHAPSPTGDPLEREMGAGA